MTHPRNARVNRIFEALRNNYSPQDWRNDLGQIQQWYQWISSQQNQTQHNQHNNQTQINSIAPINSVRKLLFHQDSFTPAFTNYRQDWQCAVLESDLQGFEGSPPTFPNSTAPHQWPNEIEHPIQGHGYVRNAHSPLMMPTATLQARASQQNLRTFSPIHTKRQHHAMTTQAHGASPTITDLIDPDVFSPRQQMPPDPAGFGPPLLEHRTEPSGSLQQFEDANTMEHHSPFGGTPYQNEQRFESGATNIVASHHDLYQTALSRRASATVDAPLNLDVTPAMTRPMSDRRLPARPANIENHFEVRPSTHRNANGDHRSPIRRPARAHRHSTRAKIKYTCCKIGCNKTFARKREYEQHLQDPQFHPDTRIWRCVRCNKDAGRFHWNYKRHLMDVHGFSDINADSEATRFRESLYQT